MNHEITEYPTDPIHISIFHTNDMHCRLEAIARLSAFSRRLRSEAEAQGREVFFWDAGDAADRRVRFCSLSKGAAFSPLLNAMGYTLQTMGNAISLPYGPQALAAVAARTGFPILAANCRDGDGPLTEGLQETVLIPIIHDLKMGVIGLTAPWGDLYELFGLHLPDFCDVARDLVGRLREQSVSLVIVLSHLGLEDDRRLVDTVPGIDLIIGGHSHTHLPNGETHNDVLITQAGQFAEALGRVDITLDPATGKVIERSAQVLEVPEDTQPDPLVMEAIAAAEREAEALMAEPIGVLQAPLDLDHFQECGIGNLTADALRERLDADAAIISSGQFHQDLPSGTITPGTARRGLFLVCQPQPDRGAGIANCGCLGKGFGSCILRA